MEGRPELVDQSGILALRLQQNNNDNCCNDGLNNFRNNAHLTADTVKLGFNYFWNAPPAPLK